jgi:hypothetical protein
MNFEVNLIRVPFEMTTEQRKEIDDNCRHVEGRWWIFEGDEDALDVPIRVFTTGVTTGLHPDDIPPGKPIIDHAVEIFRLGSWPLRYQ